MPDLLGVVRTASLLTDRVLVSFSGGKDSVVALDLCAKHFEHVEAFFMYHVPDLSFQERELKWAENKYGITIKRIPHFEVSDFLRDGTYNDFWDEDVKRVKILQVYNYLREQTGVYWIAAGERIADSIIRRAMIVKDGTINEKCGRIYPIAHWTKADVLAHIRRNKLRVAEETAVFGHSFRSLEPKELHLLKQHYPEDFEKVLAMYPRAEAGVKWWELYGPQASDQPNGQSDPLPTV